MNGMHDIFARRLLVWRAAFIFLLVTLITLLMTLVLGLVWCHSAAVPESASPAASPVGTWVDADSWESGSSHGDIVVEFTEGGLVSISANSFSALYRYENDTLYLLNIQCENELPFASDAFGENGELQLACTITGDHMSLSYRLTDTYYRKNWDLIRISSETGLTADEISALY